MNVAAGLLSFRKLRLGGTVSTGAGRWFCGLDRRLHDKDQPDGTRHFICVSDFCHRVRRLTPGRLLLLDGTLRCSGRAFARHGGTHPAFWTPRVRSRCSDLREVLLRQIQIQGRSEPILQIGGPVNVERSPTNFTLNTSQDLRQAGVIDLYDDGFQASGNRRSAASSHRSRGRRGGLEGLQG